MEEEGKEEREEEEEQENGERRREGWLHSTTPPQILPSQEPPSLPLPLQAPPPAAVGLPSVSSLFPSLPSGLLPETHSGSSPLENGNRTELYHGVWLEGRNSYINSSFQYSLPTTLLSSPPFSHHSSLFTLLFLSPPHSPLSSLLPTIMFLFENSPLLCVLLHLGNSCCQLTLKFTLRLPGTG